MTNKPEAPIEVTDAMMAAAMDAYNAAGCGSEKKWPEAAVWLALTAALSQLEVPRVTVEVIIQAIRAYGDERVRIDRIGAEEIDDDIAHCVTLIRTALAQRAGSLMQ